MGAMAIRETVLPKPALVLTAMTNPARAHAVAAMTAGRGVLLNRPQAAAATARTVRKFSRPTMKIAIPRPRITASGTQGTGCAPGGPGATA
jgi:hypothetical protein